MTRAYQRSHISIIQLYKHSVWLMQQNGDKISGVSEIIVSDDKNADARMEQIISALKDKDRKALKSLF